MEHGEEKMELTAKSHSCEVSGIINYNNSICCLRLKFSDDAMQFKAGQYVNFVMNDGGSRPLSIANAPNDQSLLELHIKKSYDESTL